MKKMIDVRPLRLPIVFFIAGIAFEQVGLAVYLPHPFERVMLFTSLSCYAFAIGVGTLRSPLLTLPLAVIGGFFLPHEICWWSEWSILGNVTMLTWWLGSATYLAGKLLRRRPSVGPQNPDVVVLQRIFSCCEILDVDLSKWDERISLWVLAENYESWTTRMPLIAVHFVQPYELKLERISPVDSAGEADTHVPWRVQGIEVSESLDALEVRLQGRPDAPSLRIRCKSTIVEKKPPDMLDKLFPGWDKAGTGLVRPGIDGLPGSETGVGPGHPQDSDADTQT